MKEEDEEAFALYRTNAADLDAALNGVTQATKLFKVDKAKSASLLQVGSASKTIDYAVMLADALGLRSAQSVSQIFLQIPKQNAGDAPEVQREEFKFHSAGIVKELEKLVSEFRAKKNELDMDERGRRAAYNMFKQKNKDFLKETSKELGQNKDSNDKKTATSAEETGELKTETANLLDDERYLAKLSDACASKAKTFDQRSKLRNKEIMAITTALEIVKSTVSEKTGSATIRFAQMGSALHSADAVANDEEAMMTLEAEAEADDMEAGTPIAFFQKQASAMKHQTRSAGDEATEIVITLLKTKGMQLKSTALLGLATQLNADPFKKIKSLIQELVERLLQEAANEGNQKGWCDKALGDATQKRAYAQEKADELGAEIAELSATRDKLKEELSNLAADIKALKQAQRKAQTMRKEEKEENKETVFEAKLGLRATQQAMTILDRFYKTAAKEKVKLLQESAFATPPKTSFETGDAYKGNSNAAGGIVAMLEVIASDFERTIQSTMASEEAAVKEHYDLLTETGMSMAEKFAATKQQSKYKDDTEENLSDAEDSLKAQRRILAIANQELAKLDPVCHPKAESYEDRVAKREQEIGALNKALCIVSNEGVVSEC